MSMTVARESFGALATRNSITSGTGTRVVQGFGDIVQSGSWWDSLFNLAQNFIVNAAGMIANMLRFSATQVVEWVLEAATFVYEFNWDVSDEQIEAQIKQLYVSFELRVVEILGRNLGSLVAVGIGGGLAFYVNPMLAKLLLAQVADEIFQELIGDMSGLLILLGKSLVTAGFLQTYKTARSFIKHAYRNPQIKAIAKSIGISDEAINSWGDSQVEDWSFSNKVEESIESLGNQRLQNLIEGFLTEADSGFRDTAMYMASAWDAMQFREQPEPQTLVYHPNRSSPEQFYVHGDSAAIANQVMTINTVSTALQNRDVGAMTVTDDDRPVITNNGITIRFFFLNTLELPYGKANRDSFAKAELIVPNVMKSKITWDKLVELFRPHAFTDGDWKGVMDLENGRQLVSRGNSENECRQLLTKFLQLTEVELRGTPIYSHRDGPQTNRWRRRKQQPMYLSHFYVTNYTRATKYEDAGTPNRARHITQRINVGSGSKPLTFDYYLAQAVDSSV